MNLSGGSVRRWMESTKAPLINCLVVVDAAELPLGELRLRPKGSSSGQNGIKNIIENLKSDHFARLRIGISRPTHVRRIPIALPCWLPMCLLRSPTAERH